MRPRFFPSLDPLLSLFVIILLCPVLILISLLIIIIDRHNPVFSQLRVGLDQKLFSIYKFKTMRPSSEPYSTISSLNLNRVTKLGRYLRKSKLDELPQLFNILLGHMRFIGYRPDTFAQLETTRSLYPMLCFSIIHFYKPGLLSYGSLVFRDEESLFVSSDHFSIEQTNNLFFATKLVLDKAMYRDLNLRPVLTCFYILRAFLNRSTFFSFALNQYLPIPLVTYKSCESLVISSLQTS